MQTDQEKAVEVWEAALASPIGIRVRTDDVQRLVQVLYEYKRQSDDPRLLQFTIAQRGSTVLVARTRAEIKTNGGYRPLEDP